MKHITRLAWQRAIPSGRGGHRGFSLVEIALAIALVAGMVVAGAVWINRILQDQQMNSVRVDAAATMNAAMAAYASFTSTVSATPATLSSQNVWPADRVSWSGQKKVVIRGHFPGSQEFMWGNTDDWNEFPVGVGFIYHITELPPRVCAQLVTSLAVLPHVHRAWAGIHVRNPEDGRSPAKKATSQLTVVKKRNVDPVDLVELAAACDGNSKKHIAFAFFKS